MCEREVPRPSFDKWGVMMETDFCFSLFFFFLRVEVRPRFSRRGDLVGAGSRGRGSQSSWWGGRGSRHHLPKVLAAARRRRSSSGAASDLPMKEAEENEAARGAAEGGGWWWRGGAGEGLVRGGGVSVKGRSMTRRPRSASLRVQKADSAVFK